MRSKTSCFNGTLFRKNLSRYWPLWGLASFIGALFPLAMLVNLLHSGFQNAWTPMQTKEMYYAVLSYGVPVISIVYAVLCAMAVWNYLYNARSVGLMHTLPIRREGLFVTNVLSGLVMMAIPYAVTGVLIVLVSLLYGGFEPVGVLVTILGVAGESIFFFGLATFCAFIVGNVFMLPALYGLLNFLAVLTDFTVNLLAQGFCFGLNSSYSGTVEWLSPVVYLMQQVQPDSIYEETLVQNSVYGPYSTHVLTEVHLENGWLIAVYAAVGVVLLVLAWLLYRRRRSESAGDVVAVNWMKPVFRYGWAAFSAILGGRLLYALFWESFQNGPYFTVLPMVLCMIVGGAIGFYAASMLLAKTLRVFRSTWKGMLAVALGCIALCGAMKYDVFGVVRRVPAADSVKQVNLYAAGSNYYLTPGQDDELIEEVRALHQAIISDKDYALTAASAASEAYSSADGEIPGAYASVRFTYTLNSGLKVERWYSLYLTRDRMAQEGTYDNLLDRLINSPEMRQKRIRRQTAGFQMGSAWINTRTGGTDLNSREVETILDAVARDAENENWGVYDWFVGRDDADNYDITVHIGYLMEERQYDNIDISVREGMTETIQALKDLGLVTDEDLVLNREAYPWQYSDDGWEEYDRFYNEFGMSPEAYYDLYGSYPAGWFGTGEDADPDSFPDDSFSISMSAGAASA